MIDPHLLSQVKTLSAIERIELLGVVWETLKPDETPATIEEKQLLDTRLADFQKNPNDQSPWREVQARIRLNLPLVTVSMSAALPN